MVDEDSHPTDLSVSGEEGHSTILLAHYIFWFQLWTKLFSNAGYAAKYNCTKMLRNLTFVVKFVYFSIRPWKICFFRATFKQLSLQKATFNCFLSIFWETFWEITGNFLENLEQLVESPSRVISMEFLPSFLRRHFAVKPVMESRNVGCFLRL